VSYLARLSARAVGQVSPTRPAITPKGMPCGQPTMISREAEEPTEEKDRAAPLRTSRSATLHRQEEPAAEEKAAPLRRKAARPEEEEPVAAPLRRQESEEGEEEAAPLRRQAPEEGEEDVAPLRRQAEEEEAESDVAPLRRQAKEEEAEGDAAPMRRQEEDGEEPEVSPKRVIARQEEVPVEETGQTEMPRPQAGLTPGAEPPLEEFAAEPEPPAMHALRRAALPASEPAAPAPRAGSVAPPAAEPAPTPLQFRDRLGEPSIPQAGLFGTGHETKSPDVVIEQVDILIHEPSPPQARNTGRQDQGRAMRARYLRRL